MTALGSRRVLVVSAAATLVIAATPATAGTGPATIRITDTQTEDTLVNRGEPGAVAGELEIIRQVLYNRRVSAKAIGHAIILCTLVGGDTRMCTGNYTLPRGTLVTTGAITSRLLYEIPIVGGTDLYDNARGLLVVTTTSLKPRREILLFRLAG